MNAAFVGSQDRWDIYASDHSEQRSNERGIPYSDMIFNISLLIDLFKEVSIEDDICDYSKSEKWSHNEKRVQIRDDINDTCYILKFYPDENEIHIITCINQKEDRELTGRKHTSMKPNHLVILINKTGYSMYVTSDNFYVDPIKFKKCSLEEYEM